MINKKLIIGFVVALFVVSISSCDRHTCPTYSKVEKTISTSTEKA